MDLPPNTKTLTANEKIVDLFTERAIDLLRLEAGTRDKVVLLLQELEGEITRAIEKIDPTAPTKLSSQRVRLEALLKVVTESIRATYRTTDVLMAREIREVADIEGTWTARTINDSVGVELVTGGLTRQFLATVASDIMIQGAPTKEWWGRQAQGLSDRFADEMRRGMALGETNAELVTRVRGTKTVRGLMDLSRTSAERLVRASVQTAANVAREQMYAENTDVISALAWSSTLDTRTTVFCIVRDGLLYNAVTHEPIGHDVPWLEGPGKIHWGCRSSSVPVMKSWKELGIDAPEVPQSTRASMDGQVPASQTFEDWLRKQSETRQDTVLGAGKADLWRSGKIEFRDLLDQSGRPLTTEALRAKAARRG